MGHTLGEITVCGFCPFALLPFCPFALALAPVMVLLFIYVLAAIKRRHFCICFHISVPVQISSTLLMLLLPAQMTTMTFFFGDKQHLCPFWLQLLKLYLNI